MVNLSRPVLILLFAISPVLCGFAQKSKDGLISGNFSNFTFTQLVLELEARTNYHFFYNPLSVDSLRINVSLTETKVSALLDDLFKNTNLNYAIDADNNIYITQGSEIQAELPSDFFDRGENTGEKLSNRAQLDYLDLERAEKSKSLEEQLYHIGKRTATIGPGKATLAGHIRDAENGEPVIGASVADETGLSGISTDQFGYYALTLPKGAHQLKIKSVGMKTTLRRIILYSDGQLDIEQREEVTPLKEVIIESEKDKNISGMHMGLDKLDIKLMKRIPVALGEVDIFKVVLSLPGVQSVGEGTTGLNVRGGATNQNLILFNDATLYNPTHLFGFFSAFNPDVVKDVELFKSGIPAEYGGRLSSVLDIKAREGNKKKFAGSGGIGPLTGRLTLEGPLIKDKASFLLGVRSTYSDWLLKLIPNESLRNSKASFYDVNLNINHEINTRNSVYFTGYFSQDHFTLNSDTLYGYRNKNATLKWKHIFGSKLYGVLTGAYSGYDYSIASEKNSINGFSMSYAINQTQWKADFSYFPTSKHSINFGLSTISYSISPGSFLPRGSQSLVFPDILPKEQALESAIYVSDQFDVSPRLSLYGGIRYSLFYDLGPRTVNRYTAGQPKDLDNVIGAVSYPSGRSFSIYHGPEYRISAKYLLTENSSVKFSFNRMRQYLQMLSNTAAISPTDIWKLSDPNIKPQIGDQVALGIYKNFRSNTIETSVEGYYKAMRNSLDYKGGDSLILNHHVETAIVGASGKAYGVEIMIKKMSGKVNGWISYTWSRTLLRTQSTHLSEIVNNNRYYPANYDKPHAVNFVGNYKFSHRFSTSLNLAYSTGRPITLPIAKYDENGSMRLYYSERNQYRIPDYFRIDFAMNIEGNHRIKKLAHSSWTVGVYNLLGRKNPYSVFFESKDGVVKGYQLSIFAQPIPTITYNFRF